MPAPHRSRAGARSPARRAPRRVPGTAARSLSLTVIPRKPKSHFPAAGATLLYAARHRHRSPPAAHTLQERREKGFFTRSVSGFYYHSRDGWETPRQSPRSPFGVSTSPAAGGEVPQTLCVTPSTEPLLIPEHLGEHPWEAAARPKASVSHCKGTRRAHQRIHC